MADPTVVLEQAIGNLIRLRSFYHEKVCGSPPHNSLCETTPETIDEARKALGQFDAVLKALRRLNNAAWAYSVEQDPTKALDHVGRVQPITIGEANELNVALAEATTAFDRFKGARRDG